MVRVENSLSQRYLLNRDFLFLSNVYAIARPSVVSLSVCLSVCLSSVTFVRPTITDEIFGNISTALGTLAIR